MNQLIEYFDGCSWKVREIGETNQNLNQSLYGLTKFIL